jgi:hypothetical protein
MTRTAFLLPLTRFLPILGLASLSAVGFSATQTQLPTKPLVLVHTMPWFMAKPTGQVWGWHWTMGRYDPDVIKSERRQIASHDYPLIGPYDSSDPDVLEYHALLMKIAGIDGSVIDWYGTTDFLDYALIHRNTIKWIETLKRFGLRYTICYEDQAVKHMVEANFLPREQSVNEGGKHQKWLEENVFRDPLYVKWNRAPLLLVYGPQYFNEKEWEELFSRLSQRPTLFSLDDRRPPAMGTFAWPPMWKSQGKTLTQAMLDEYLDRFYAKREPKMAMALPGFHDSYQEAGVRPSYGFLDRDNGAVFTRTLDKAMKSGSPFVQIATWNDFGEGTDIEPTREYGYRYLEILQKEARSRKKAAFPYQSSDLRLPLQIYHLRKRGMAKETLDKIVRDLSAGRVIEARKSLLKEAHRTR